MNIICFLDFFCYLSYYYNFKGQQPYMVRIDFVLEHRYSLPPTVMNQKNHIHILKF
jgi:hypothetical protein